MSEERKIHRRQRPAPPLAEPSAAKQDITDKPTDVIQGLPVTKPVVRVRTRPEPPASPVEPSSSSPEQIPVRGGGDARPAPRRRTGRKEYAVGYMKPPKEHQFKPKNNANPNGRPKGSKNIPTKVAEALDEKVTVLRHGKPHKMTKRDIIVERLVNKLVETIDPRLLKTVLDMFPPTPVDAPETAPNPRDEASNEAILKFVEAMVQKGASLLPPASKPPSDLSNGDDMRGKQHEQSDS